MSFSLGSIFKSVSAAVSPGEVSYIGLDIGAASAKIVQLRASRGVAVLETYGEIALGPYGNQPIGKAVKLSAEKTAEAVTDLMREANVTAHTGGLSIPFSSSLVSVLDLPKADRESLARIVPIEARKYIPVPITEVTLDWFVIPHEEGESSAFDEVQGKAPVRVKGQEVFLVAIHNDLLQQYQTIASGSNLKANFYEIEIFSSLRSSLGHGIAPILVVDFGAASTKMYIVERGIVRLTHLLPVGGQQMTETLARSLTWEFDKAERVKREHGLMNSTAYSMDENDRIKSALLSTLTRVFGEVNRVLLSYGQRYNKNVSHVVFTGGGASLPGIAAYAKENLSAEVEVANPFGHTEAPAFLENVLREIGPGFSVSVGLALRNLKH
jgi:type IV pilus assembly protein PilM